MPTVLGLRDPASVPRSELGGTLLFLEVPVITWPLTRWQLCGPTVPAFSPSASSATL